MKDRTPLFALRAIRLTESLPKTSVGDAIRKQLLRSGTSVGSNYRAARRANSKADFISKLKTVEEEADESLYGMELLVKPGTVPKAKLADLMRECDEITAIVVATIKSTRGR